MRRTLYSRRLLGTTLVEVLVALALLGSVLVALILARGRLVEQRARAERLLEAVATADALLDRFWQNGGRVPESDGGELRGEKAFRWRTSVVANDGAAALGCHIVRLELFDARGGRREEAMTAVDLIAQGRFHAMATETVR